MRRLIPTSRGLRALVIPMVLAAGLAACDDDDSVTTPDARPDIAELASSSAELSTLVAALQTAGLVEALQADGPFTVFAPRDAAFDALGSTTVSALLAEGNRAALTDLLTYHVVSGRFTAADLAGGAVLPTLAGKALRVEGGAGVSVDGAAVVTADLEAGNGIVHVIDAVLVNGLNGVQRAALTPEVSTLVAALEASGLAHPLEGPGPFTIFAPVNAAFDALDVDALLADGELLDQVLRYHVVRGEVRAGDLEDGQTLTTLEGSRVTVDLDNGASINGASVIAADIDVGNGVIHLIDGVLLEALDIVERASLTPAVSTLVTAVGAADLAGVLSGPGPFTVFAPVNDAFAGVDVAALLEAGSLGLLQDILTYHVIPGEVRAADLVDGATVRTVEGGTVTIDLDGGPKVNGANIVATDIRTDNGVIHLIDGVLLESLDIVQRASIESGVSTLVAAVGAADLAGVLSGPGPFTVFAPVNDAFAGVDVAALLEPGNLGLLQDILTYHVIPGEVRAADLVDGAVVGTVEGGTVTIDLDGGPKVNGANIVATDIETENGVIHLIDGVLLESLDIVQRASIESGVSTLVTAVGAADLAGVLSGPGPFTVFAPVNDAFAGIPAEQIGRLLAPENQALLQKVLTYHVIPGEVRAADLVDGAVVGTVEGATVTIDLDGGPKVNGANIIATDIETENGVIHLIDGVLLENLDIVDQAVLNGFGTLVGAVQAAGLEAALRSDNGGAGFTVFAPTEAAFAALSAVPSDPAVLADILLYHVLGGEVRSTDLSDGLAATTLQGGSFTVRLPASGPAIEGARNTVSIVVTDVEAANGVIHVIDAVLLPPTT